MTDTLAPSLEELKSLVSQYRYHRPLANSCRLESRDETGLSGLIDRIGPETKATIHVFTSGDTLNATHSSQNIVLIKPLESYRARLEQRAQDRLPMLYDLFFDRMDPEHLRIAMQHDVRVSLGYNSDGWYRIENGPVVNMCLTAVPRLTRDVNSDSATETALQRQLLKAAYEGAYLCALMQESRELYLVMPTDPTAVEIIDECHARYSRHPRSRLQRVVKVTTQPINRYPCHPVQNRHARQING